MRSALAILGDVLQRYGVIAAFIALVAWNAGLAENAEIFRRPENVRNILNQNAAMGIVAVGMTLVIVAGGIDLAVGSVVALAGTVALLVANVLVGREFAEPLAIAIGFAAGLGTGLLCGALNGALVTVGRIPPFIATLGGLVGYRSIALALADAGEIRAAKTGVLESVGRGGIPAVPGDWLASGRPLVLFWNIVVFLLVAIVGQIVLSRTRYGRHLIAVGGNEIAARYSGIAVGRVRFISYLIVGVASAVAGLLLAARMQSVSSAQLGMQLELDAIAAVVIGGTSMTGGRGRIWGTVLGVLILAIINNMLVVAQVSPHWQGAMKGAIIVLAVLIQRGRAT